MRESVCARAVLPARPPQKHESATRLDELWLGGCDLVFACFFLSLGVRVCENQTRRWSRACCAHTDEALRGLDESVWLARLETIPGEVRNRREPSGRAQPSLSVLLSQQPAARSASQLSGRQLTRQAGQVSGGLRIYKLMIYNVDRVFMHKLGQYQGETCQRHLHPHIEHGC